LLSPARVKASQATATLTLPLLNLDGPPVVGDEIQGSPKKKRKRRKKRKSSLVNAAMETTIN